MGNEQRSGARRRRRARGLALLGLLAVGCGGGSATPTVASLGGHGAGSGSAAGALTPSQSDADMVSFAGCMRAHGVQMSDPFHRPGHEGLSIEVPPRTAGTAAGYAACSHYLAPIVAMKERGAAARAAPELPALTRWAECMRSHNIGMLDPTPQGALSLGNVPGITANYGRYSPQFRAADAACRHILPATVRDDGTGP